MSYQNIENLDFWSAIETIRDVVQTDTDAAQNYLDKLFGHTAHGRATESENRLSLLKALAASLELSDPDRLGSPARDYTTLTATDVTNPGVSIVVGCRDRANNLLKSIQTWLANPEVSEIVIVDWSSKVPVWDSLFAAGIEDPRIRIFRVLGESKWCLSEALNVGFRLARFESVFKADADTMIATDFFRENRIGENEFRAGNWRTGQGDLNGSFYARLSDILAVSGYSEFIRAYGWDDEDLYMRLVASGLLRRDFVLATARGIEHDDTFRIESDEKVTEKAEQTAQRALSTNREHLIYYNKLLTAILPEWPWRHTCAQFRIRWESDRKFLLRRFEPATTQINEELEKALHQLAAYRRLCDFQPQIYSISPDQLTSLIEAKSLEDIDNGDLDDLLLDGQKEPIASPNITPSRRRRFFADLQHGLGNRMRTWASAAQIAKELDAELVVIWQPDHHCGSELHDLFDYEGTVIQERFISGARAAGFDVYNYLEGEEGGIKDELIRPVRDNDIYVRSSSVLNSSLSSYESLGPYLNTLRPSEEVRHLIESVRRPNLLSAHVRMVGGTGFSDLASEGVEQFSVGEYDEVTRWRATSHYNKFFARIDGLIDENRDLTMFVAADTEEAYAAFQDRYGPRLTYLERTVFDRSAQQLKYALADMILLGQATIMLGSTWSSFSEVAKMMSESLEQVEMSGVDF